MATDVHLAITPEQWREDLHYLAAQMPLKHKNLFHHMTQSEFQAAVAKLDADIPQLNEDQLIVRFMQLGALIQDGHSGLFMHGVKTDIADRMPVRFDRYADGIYIRAASPEYADAVGGKVIKIGSMGWKEAIARVDTVIAHDPGNEGEQISASGKLYLNSSHLLHGLGLTPSAESSEFVVEKSGQLRTWHFKASAPLGMWYLNSVPKGWVDAHPASAPVPPSRQHEDKLYWLMPLPQQHALYVQFNAVENDSEESIAAFAHRLSESLSKPEVERVIVDVRSNTGGDNTQLRPLLLALIRSRQNHRGNLFVLIGPTTFSAAENFCNRMANYTDAIFVGQPTGENVNMYGDAVPITMPNSHLQMFVSTLFWQDMDPRDKRPAMFPEVAIEPSFADYIAGKDPTLAFALTASAPNTIQDELISALPAGIDVIVARYRTFVDDPAHKFVNNPEARVNTLGYTLVNEQKLAEALLIFHANVRVHPRSANAWDSLGEALFLAGQKNEGLEAYKKSLELNPNNANAKRVLEEAGKQ